MGGRREGRSLGTTGARVVGLPWGIEGGLRGVDPDIDRERPLRLLE